MEDVIVQINEGASQLCETDINDEFVGRLAEHYRSRIDRHAVKIFGAGLADVSRLAFRETAKNTLRNGAVTFLFKSELWKVGRNIDSYLLTCLKRLAQQTQADQENAKRANVLVCPACRDLGEKSYLIPESKMWRCSNCTSEIDRLANEIKASRSDVQTAPLRKRQRLHKLFSLHSRRGYRCPEKDCGKFIPESLNGKFGVSCPYADCDFFGKIENLEQMSHPSALSHRRMLSLNSKPKGHNSLNKSDNNGITLQDMFESEAVAPDVKMVVGENFEREFKILMEVIESQITLVRRMNARGTYMQKFLMYEAFKSMTSKFPEEMVSYLVHLRQSADFPIQARIFQEYVSLTENALPFTIERRGELIDIMSLSDPNLGLFRDGTSTFDAIVGDNGVIPNNTIETYTGSRKFKCFGPCFIGMVSDVVIKKTGESIRKKIKGYSFVQIDMGETVAPGTEVTVTHYRIPSHYEMGSLVFLQRLRRHIVDKVFFRVHGRKRTTTPVRKSNVA